MNKKNKKYKRRKAQIEKDFSENLTENKRQHAKLTPRERIEALLDPRSFFELNLRAESPSRDFDLAEKKAPGDGVIAGWGRIAGREVCLFSQDASVLGGSIGPVHGRKMMTVAELAGKRGVPLITLNDSAGLRIQEAQSGPHGGEAIFLANTLNSGIVPQIAVILGSCAGVAVYSPALMDFVIMADGIASMFLTGPRVIREVTGENITHEALGGAGVHCCQTGLADRRGRSEEECFALVRELLSYLPSNHLEAPPLLDLGDDPGRKTDQLAKLVPADGRQPYDVIAVIQGLADQGRFFELKPEYAPEASIGFIRLAGRSVGVVANNPLHLSGALTVDASDKCARHVRFCDCFNIPLLYLMDVPGYFPGVKQEQSGIIRHGAKMLYAFCEATVPKVTLVLRKGYGGGILAMGGSKALGADLILAWPGAEMGVVGASAAVNVLYREQIEKAADPEAVRKKLIQEFHDQFANPFYSTRTGAIDDVIESGQSRLRLIQAFDFLSGKRESRPRKKHGNIPL
jgi:acetyl-CoA carboxylase carboxyltransferase component